MDGDDGTWAGDAARAFRASLDDGFRPQLIDVHEDGLTEGLEAERDMKAQGAKP